MTTRNIIYISLHLGVFFCHKFCKCNKKIVRTFKIFKVLIVLWMLVRISHKTMFSRWHGSQGVCQALENALAKFQLRKLYSQICIKQHCIKWSPCIKPMVVKNPNLFPLSHYNFHLYWLMTFEWVFMACLYFPPPVLNGHINQTH